ncbi:MAG: DUF4381 domain-containing protein [Pseudomonadales bacterium]
MLDGPGSNSFGNYILHGIDEIVMPEAVSWMPQTLGWKILAVLVCVGLAFLSYRAASLWLKNRYRRAALRQLDALATEPGSKPSAQLMTILKATALQAFPREQVAGISGESWLEFLDQHCDKVQFNSDLGRRLIQSQYAGQVVEDDRQAQQAIAMAKVWVSRHTRAS